MNKIVAIVITILLSMMFVYDYKKRRDLFSPICFFSLFTFITRVPRILILDEITIFNIKYSDGDLFLYLIYFMIYLLFIFFSMDYFTKKYSINFINDKFDEKILKKGLCLVALGVFSQILLIELVGGVSFIWNNISKTSFLLSGYGYILWLTVFSTYGIGLLLSNFLVKNKLKNKIIFWGVFSGVCLLTLAFGKRAPLFRMITAIIPIIYYYDRDIVKRIVSVRNLMIGTLLCFVLIVFPLMRTSNFEVSLSSITGLISMNNSIYSIIYNISPGVDADLFTFTYFTEHDKWLGKSYIDLLYAWIPSSILQNKPPVDDGVYLNNLMLGFNVEPSLSINEFPHRSSVPFTNEGFAFANFGVLGLIVYSFLYGLIICKQYNKIKGETKVIDIIFYGMLISTLALSVKGTVELIMGYFIYRFVKLIAKYKIRIKY